MCIRIILWSTIGGRGEFVLKQTAHFVLKFDLEVQSVPAGLVGGRVIDQSDAQGPKSERKFSIGIPISYPGDAT